MRTNATKALAKPAAATTRAGVPARAAAAPAASLPRSTFKANPPAQQAELEAVTSLPADRELWKWLKAGGATVNFKPGYSVMGVRGGYATRNIPAKGVVAKIPMKLTVKFPAKWKHFVALGELLAVEARNPRSRYRPYLSSLPSLAYVHNTLSWESYPAEYLHLLQGAAPLAERVVAMQGATRRYWARHGARLLEAGVTLDGLRAALVTISTRWYQGPMTGPEAGHMALIPAYDLLNHRNGCPVYYDFEPCNDARSPGGICCVVRTGSPIKKGEEVCNSYNHLTPDLALFHYGFQLPEEAGRPPAMNVIDSPGFTPAALRRAHLQAPAPLRGSPADMARERARLTTVLGVLRRFQPIAEATQPAAVDPRGEILASVLAWRKQRMRALQAEIARLDKAIAAAAAKGKGKGAAPRAAAAAGGSPAQKGGKPPGQAAAALRPPGRGGQRVRGGRGAAARPMVAAGPVGVLRPVGMLTPSAAAAQLVQGRPKKVHTRPNRAKALKQPQRVLLAQGAVPGPAAARPGAAAGAMATRGIAEEPA